MTEKSMLWTTGATGDGASPYTQAETIRMFRQWLVGDDTDEGVFKTYLNELEVTGTSSPVAVNTGAACVYGFTYWNTASVNVVVPTPSANTRIDRVVLEADWSAQTVRIVRVAGTEGTGTPPSLTQTDGVTWQISLAQASITTGGVITVTDERVFLHPNVEVETAMLADETVTAAKIENRTRRFLVPAIASYNLTDTTDESVGSDPRGALMVDSKLVRVLGHFFVPDDYASGMAVEVVIRTGASGNVYGLFNARYGAEGEDYQTHTVTDGYSAKAVTNAYNNMIHDTALTGVAKGDVVTLLYTRDATDALDTLNNIAYSPGFLVTYTADS